MTYPQKSFYALYLTNLNYLICGMVLLLILRFLTYLQHTKIFGRFAYLIADFAGACFVCGLLFAIQLAFFVMLYSLIQMQSANQGMNQMLQSLYGNFSTIKSVLIMQLVFLVTNALASVLFTVYFVNETIKKDYES